jgi:prepilin peptidase CpaA
MSASLLNLVFPALMILAGVKDAFTYRIPNWLTLTVALLFWPFALLQGMPMDMLLWHAVTGVVLLVIGFALFAMGLFGGGDAKLMAAAGFWFGWPVAMKFLVFTALAGGALALVIALWTALQMDQEMRGHTWIERFKNKKIDVPYGVAFAAGAVIAFPDSWWWQVPN